LKVLATQNTIFDNVAETMYMYSCNRDVLEECRKIEDAQKFMAYQKNKIEALETKNAEQAARIAYLEAQLNQNK
jgi:hypothetical protein